MTEVPLANAGGCVTALFEQIGNGYLFRIKADVVFLEKDIRDADTSRVASGQ